MACNRIPDGRLLSLLSTSGVRNTATKSGAQDIANILTTLLQLLLLAQHHRACPAWHDPQVKWDILGSHGIMQLQVGLGEGLAPSSATNVMARLVPE